MGSLGKPWLCAASKRSPWELALGLQAVGALGALQAGEWLLRQDLPLGPWQLAQGTHGWSRCMGSRGLGPQLGDQFPNHPQGAVGGQGGSCSRPSDLADHGDTRPEAMGSERNSKMQRTGRVPETLVLPVQSRQKISCNTKKRAWVLWGPLPSPALGPDRQN